MSKLINEPIQLHRDNTSNKTSFIWRKRLYRVERVLDWWREPAAWWDEEPLCLFVRVNAANTSTGTYELCKCSDKWLISRILD
ncbi:MAG: DUF6504 family protein [Dehalococcoidales bacterium]|nr:DUF6504 family protein [Dehalococcoidales bacterium]